MFMPLAVKAADMLSIRVTNAMLRIGDSWVVMSIVYAATSHRPY